MAGKYGLKATLSGGEVATRGIRVDNSYFRLKLERYFLAKEGKILANVGLSMIIAVAQMPAETALRRSDRRKEGARNPMSWSRIIHAAKRIRNDRNRSRIVA